jgi:predicted small integral membrane protein
MDLEWMAWTLPTATFFIVIALMLMAMTAWQLVSPGVDRKGFLPIITSRGDRLFIGLLTSAYIHLAWLGLTELSLWWALGISIVWLIVLMRWG